MKNLKFILPALAFIALLFTGTHLNAQIHVTANGNVGINRTAPSYKLDILNSGTTVPYSFRNRNYYTGTAQKIAFYNYCNASGTGRKYGIYNITYSPTSTNELIRGIYSNTRTYSNTTSVGTYNYLNSLGGNGTRYGLFNYLNCDASNDGTGSRIALYSRVVTNCDGGSAWAGYFVGNVYVSGTVTQTSDETKKRNVETFDHAMDIIGDLKPRTYDYIQEGNLSLPTEKQYGFIAQDLENILPELVKDVPVFSDPEAMEAEGELSDSELTGTIKSVNYTAMIPILVQGMQEQQEIIEQQQIQMKAQQAEIDALKAKMDQE